MELGMNVLVLLLIMCSVFVWLLMYVIEFVVRFLMEFGVAVLGLGDQEVEDVVRKGVPRWFTAHHVEFAFENPEPVAQHQFTEQRRGKPKAGCARVQPRPSTAVLMCDQEELV